MVRYRCNLADSLCTYDYLHSAVYNSTEVLNGQKVNEFTWMEGIGAHAFRCMCMCMLCYV